MEITQISTEDLNNLFGSTGSEETTDNAPIVDPFQMDNDPNIPLVDLDTLEDEPEATPEKEPVAEATPTEETTEEKAEPTTEEVAAPTAEESSEIKQVLKNTVDFLIEKGKWQDFEGREDMDLDMETYSELALKQNEAYALDMFNELVDSTGGYGKAILSHIKEGGNPDEIIDLFKEQKQLEAIDVSSDQGKLVKIEKYYSEIIGWKPEKVRKHLERIIVDEEVESELSDVNEKYDEFYQEQLQALESDRIQRERAQKENQRIFTDKIKDAIYTNKEYTDKEKRMLETSILTFKNKLENGSKVNDFYVKFAEMQADPQKYVELVHFVTDPEGYKSKVKTKTETKAAVKAFNFIKGNNTVSKEKGSVHTTTHANEGKPKIDFSTLIKQK